MGQAQKHIDFSMTFIYDLPDKELEELTVAIIEFFAKNEKTLGLRIDGRWSIGITEMKNIPIGYELFKLLTDKHLK